MTVFYARRIGNALWPDGPESVDALCAIKAGKSVRVEVKTPRNIAHHRLYWQLCQRIADAVGITAENVSDMLKIETGNCDIVLSKKYGELRLPKSIAFSAMDQAAFSIFFEACVAVIQTQWGIARADVMEAIGDLLDVKTERH